MTKGSFVGWGMRLAVAIDQLANVLALGDPDETISSRAEKARRKGKRWGCVLCALLDRLDPGHCARAVELDEG
jgi:hypothetical protein